MIDLVPYILGLPLTAYFTAYATGKFMTLLGDKEKINLLATGNPEILKDFSEKFPNVLILIPSYNNKSIVKY